MQLSSHHLEISVKNHEQAEVTGILDDTSVFFRIKLGDPIEVSLSRISDNTNTHTCMSEALTNIHLAADRLLTALDGQHKGLSQAADLEYHIQQARYISGMDALKDPDEYLQEQLWSCLGKAAQLKESLQKFNPLQEKKKEPQKDKEILAEIESRLGPEYVKEGEGDLVLRSWIRKALEYVQAVKDGHRQGRDCPLSDADIEQASILLPPKRVPK